MAKLKALSKDEDLAAVPGDQPVLVQLPEFGEEQGEPDKPVKTDTEDEGVNVLKEQLEALRKANAEEVKRERDARIEAQRQRDEAERGRLAAVNSQSQTETEAVQSGLSAAQAEQNAAKLALKTAGEAGDWEAVGEAQARIARAASDIREFERSAALLAERKTEEPRQAQQQPQLDIMSSIDSNPQLLATERDWLKKHPEAYASRNKELDVAYERAIKKGLSRGTPQYFKFMDEFMGYEETQTQDDDMAVSAPVSRNDRGSDGRPSNGKIMLTVEERDLAKSMGLTDIEYARQKVNFDQARKADPAKYGDR